MRWLADCSPGAFTEALQAVAPELVEHQIVIRESLGEEDPTWWAASAVIGERFVAKFAWSQPAALRVAHEIGVLAALLSNPAVPFLPEIVASSTDPVLLVTRRDQVETVMRWCDWADDVLASPRPTVLVHADLHGGNQVWNDDELRVVVDFETAGAAEPEYDLRTFPGTGPGVELMQATVQHYQQISGRHLSADRIMAWHLRTTR